MTNRSIKSLSRRRGTRKKYSNRNYYFYGIQLDIQEKLLKVLGKTPDTINFQIQNQADILDTVSSITTMLKAFLG